MVAEEINCNYSLKHLEASVSYVDKNNMLATCLKSAPCERGVDHRFLISMDAWTFYPVSVLLLLDCRQP